MVIFLNLSSFDIALDLDGPLSHLGFLFPSLRDNLAHSCAAAADDGDDFSRFYHSHPLSLFFTYSLTEANTSGLTHPHTASRHRSQWPSLTSRDAEAIVAIAAIAPPQAQTFSP